MTLKVKLIIIAALTVVYYGAEVIFRLIMRHKPPHPVMLAVALAAVGAIVLLTTLPAPKPVFRWLMAAFSCILIEFIAGVILNIWLGLEVWSYSGSFGNLYGQICVKWALVWLGVTGVITVLYQLWLKFRVKRVKKECA